MSHKKAIKKSCSLCNRSTHKLWQGVCFRCYSKIKQKNIIKRRCQSNIIAEAESINLENGKQIFKFEI